MNSRPGSTCNNFGHHNGPHLYMRDKALATSAESFDVSGLSLPVTAGYIGHGKGILEDPPAAWHAFMW